MADILPPTPVGVPPGHSFWNDWYEKLRAVVNQGSISVLWSNINFAGSDITSIANRAHNNLQSIQGGSAGEYFHLTAAQYAALGSGGVTSVGITVPIGLTVTGSPVTTSGTLTVSYTAGYSIPTTASQTNWNTAFGWGNHASAGYAPLASPTFTGTVTLPAGQVVNGVTLTTAGGTSNFLRADGAYAAPPGGGVISAASAIMTSTQVSTIVTYADVTQLALPMVANGVYYVECFVTFQSAATTTGLGLGFTSPTGCRTMCEIVVPIASTAVASALRTTFPNTAVAANTGNVLGTGVTAINSNHTARISGIIRNGSTAGNFQVQFRSEIAASAITLQIGSELSLLRIA